jgi:uncharacterized caspase-like protein
MKYYYQIFILTIVISLPLLGQEMSGRSRSGSFNPPAKLSVRAVFTAPSEDKMLNAGQEGALELTVLNTGGSVAHSVRAILSPDKPLQGIALPETVQVGDITPDLSTVSRVNVVAADDMPSQTLTLSIIVSDSTGIQADPVSVTIATKEKERHIGPAIVLTEPAAMRGMKIVDDSAAFHTTDASIAIGGIATDAKGVLKILVNGKSARLVESDSGAEFSAEVQLDLGSNDIEIKAVNKERKEASMNFTVARDEAPLEASNLQTGRYIALVVGIDNYSGVWPALQNAVHDAKAVAQVLHTVYKFDTVITLYDNNATRSNILNQFDWLADTNNVSTADNVLIYYSGHGEKKENLNKGYWVPADAHDQKTANYISNSDIQTFLNGIPSKHTLLISDACFAGDIFRGRTEEIPFENTPKYYKEVYKRLSRQALTSGGVEPVMDGGREGHSIFTYYLLKALKNPESDYLDAGQLFEQVRIPVGNNSEQVPILSPIKNTGDEGGQFIFVRRK